MSDFSFSVSDSSLCRVIARMLLIKRIVDNKGQSFVLRMPYTKAKPLFTLGNQVSQILFSQQSYLDGKKVDLELCSMWMK
jgi:hypothetical protein